jgi:hypothetical protein
MQQEENIFARDSLAYAVATGNKEAFENLISIGFNANWRSGEDQATALHAAMLLEDEQLMLHFVSILVDRGADRHAKWDYTMLQADYSTKSYGSVTPFQLGSMMMPKGKDISSCSHARALTMALVVPCNGNFTIAPFRSDATGKVFVVFNTHTHIPVLFIDTENAAAAHIFCNAMSVQERSSNTSVLFYRFNDLFERVYIYVKPELGKVIHAQHNFEYYNRIISIASEISKGTGVLRIKAEDNSGEPVYATRLISEFHKTGGMPLVWMSTYEVYIGVHINISRVVKIEMKNIKEKAPECILFQMEKLSV